MGVLKYLLPRSLVGRVFSLYLATLLLFVLTGLGLFYRYQFTQQIEDELITGELIMNVAAQTVGDSAVIGDYDTITKTLDRAIVGSHFAKAQFIDSNSGVLTAANTKRPDLSAPRWLQEWVRSYLFEVNHNIVVGGKDYGVLRLIYDERYVASNLWGLVLYSLAVAIGAMLIGLVLIRQSLKHWLGNFDRVRVREADILSGAVDINALLDVDAPAEILHTFQIISRAAGRLSAQREEAAVTLNAINDGVLTTDADFRIVYCNPAAEQMLGLRSQDTVGQQAQAILASAFEDSGAPMDWQVRRIRASGPGGVALTLDTTLSTIYASDNRVVGHVLVLRDVTQQDLLDRQLHTALQVRQRALESLRSVLMTFEGGREKLAGPLDADDLDALTNRVMRMMYERDRGMRALDNQKFALDQHAIVSITNLQGEITYANDKFCEISGYSRQELLGSNHRIVKSDYHPAAVFEDLWRTISGGKVWHAELCNRSKSGTLYWVDATVVPLLGADGLPEQYIGIRTDITARKTFEAQLAEQLRFVEVLLEATPTAIYLKDLQGRYIRFNKAFAELFGIERAQWIGKTVFDLVPGDMAAMMHAKDQELLASGAVQTYEATFTNRSTQALREGLYWKAPLTDTQGNITGLVGTILDITEKNRFEQELREAKRNAEAASKAKSDFLANMSHEIRTPMNGVIGMTALALDTALEPQQREYLEIVKSSAKSLMVILNDILDFSKIEAGKLNIEAVNFPLPATIAQTLKTLEARAQAKGLVLTAQLAADLPQQVVGDPVRIGQVLTNLCDNAIKFTAQGSVTVEVRTTQGPQNAVELQFAVRDTGVGIPPDKQQGVFEAFHQADTSTTRQFGGTGLGLTICARLVDLMGGRIWLHSEPGMGSTFFFTVQVQLPLAQADPVKALAVPVPESPAAASATSPLQVLLVEDHPINQMLATTLLKRWGHRVVLAHNGQEAVDLFPTQHWDVVLMDMQMPVMGGLDATRAIRANEPAGQHTPIIAMTANAMESDKLACAQAGMDDHLAKPFNAADLQAMLARHVPVPGAR